VDAHVRGPLRRGGAQDPGSHRALIRSAVPLLAACALAVAACGDPRDTAEQPAPADSTAVVVDASGRTLWFERPPARVVSLVPSVTRALVELGAGAALVGRTDYDTLAAVGALPSVGGGLQPDLERLLTLQPDLVIRFGGEQDVVTPAALDERGIAHLAVRPDRVADVRAIVLQLGQVMDRGPAAASLVAELDRALADVRARVAGEPRKRVAFVLGGTPPWVAGPGTFVSDLLDAAGADNAFADLGQLYAPVSLEDLIAREVDAFVIARGTQVSPRLARRGPVLEVSPEIESPGTSLGRSAGELARALHPEAFR
jgi:iron complex transport system substrate-binding protein